MADWFAKLMQKGHAGSPRTAPRARDARYDAIVQTLRERDAQDRAGREKRQRWYQQHLKCDADAASEGSAERPPALLHRLRTKVPCRATAAARGLLDRLERDFAGATVTIASATARRRALMLAGGGCAEPKQIGWLEECIETDPMHSNVPQPGLSVETDGETMLVLRFRHPATPARVSWDGGADTCMRELPSSVRDELAVVDLAEIRPALDLRPADKTASPRLVSVTRTEVEAMNVVGSRDYEAFYLRFKLEVLAGLWSALSAELAKAPGSRWYRGAYYSVIRKSEPARFRIRQETTDHSGRSVDIGSDRIYDAAPATDILLLYLEGDILADIADIYFTLQSLDSADAYFLKEEFFAVIRRFWASSQGLASQYGGDLAGVVRMSQRALPMPTQALLLKQDWITLRQTLLDRYGQRGEKAPDLCGRHLYQPRAGGATWPFSTYPAGEFNVGLRVRYRQEWRLVDIQRGARVDGPLEHNAMAKSLAQIVNEAVDATVGAMKWPVDPDGCLNTGVRELAAWTDQGLDAEYRASSHDTCVRLADITLKTATKLRDEAKVVIRARSDSIDPWSAVATADDAGDAAPECVYSVQQNCYEVLTRPAEIENVVLIAERLLAPAEIDRWWVRRYRWILRDVLLDESLRDALDAIEQDDAAVAETRARLYEHVRANVLHYQRAVWRHEDPQQRCMRYRKSGRKVPLEWRFELECGGSLMIEELARRLTTDNVDAHFASYAGGREADLDQLIDPAGPIAYYGNYAVYRMRPEFGSADFFSMLHFFKSPYLGATPDTGKPRVEGPARGEIARRFVIDTDGVIVDVIHTRAPIDEPECVESETIPAAPPAQGGVIPCNSNAIDLRFPSGNAGELVLRRDDRAAAPSLIAGMGAEETHLFAFRQWSSMLRVSLAHGDGAERVILPQHHRLLHPGVASGTAHRHGRLIFARDDRRLRLSSRADVGAAHPHDTAIVARTDEWLRPSLVAG
jgi:hypothetical protein